MSLNAMWNRRQCTKYNGTSYIVQKAAAAVFSEEGIHQCQENLEYYRENARVITDTLSDLGIRFYGGYIPRMSGLNARRTWIPGRFLYYLLHEIQVVGTPGAGFGENGKRYFRLTSFGTYENTVEAMTRFQDLLETK